MRQPSKLKQEQLDRLVDGELNGAEYQELLRELERDPEGWRNCALAFLEAQAMRADFQHVTQPEQQIETDPRARQGKAPPKLWSALTVAASLLFAFGLGAWSQGWLVDDWFEPTRNPESQFTNTRSDGEAEVKRDAVVEQGAVPNASPENLRLIVNDENFVDVPVSEADAIDFDEIFREESQEYERILRDLERQGHVVRRTRREVPVQLEDGRRARVPVNRIEIVPVRGNYQ